MPKKIKKKALKKTKVKKAKVSKSKKASSKFKWVYNFEDTPRSVSYTHLRAHET